MHVKTPIVKKEKRKISKERIGSGIKKCLFFVFTATDILYYLQVRLTFFMIEIDARKCVGH